MDKSSTHTPSQTMDKCEKSTDNAQSPEPQVSAGDTKPSRENDITPEILVQALDFIGRGLSAIMETAKMLIRESPQRFADKPGPCLGPALSIYASGLTRLGITTIEELELLCCRFFRLEVVRDTFEVLQDTEREWDEMLKNVDKSLHLHITQEGKKVNDIVPPDLKLHSVREGKVVGLKDYCQQGPVWLVLLRHFG